MRITMMPPKYDTSSNRSLRSVLPHRIFIADPLRHASTDLLFLLLQQVSHDRPVLWMWSAQPIWSVEDFLSMAAWSESQSSKTRPITVVTQWEAWNAPDLAPARHMLEAFPFSVRWIWSVYRQHWADAHALFVHLSRSRWPDDTELDPHFTGWLESDS